MNTYDLKCYEKTYNDPRYWDQVGYTSKFEQYQLWANCRGVTDEFYNELIHRGYLVPRTDSHT
ncbi:MAG: hypothetical protein AB4058_17400 [Microcystaceae cyanobacterium]